MMRVAYPLLLSLLLGLAPLVAQAQPNASLDPPLEAAVDSLAEAALQGELGTPPVAGLAVGIAREGTPVYRRGFGRADVENGTPVTAETVFRIGSITKPFTAAAVLRLVEQGQIALDEDVRTYLPEAPTHGETVTVRQLLNHTSGIPSYTSLPDFMERSAEAITHEEMLALIAEAEPDFAPGADFQYNNSGFYLLGLLIEEVTGQDYATHLEETLFDPIGLEATGYCPDEPTGAQHARGYQPTEEGGTQPAPPVSMTQPFAAGALCSTVGDLLRWRAALDNGQVLSDAMWDEMTAPTLTAEGDTVPYGFGLSIGARDESPVQEHGGGIHGFVSQWIHFPEEGWTVTVLTNTEGPTAYRLEEVISRKLRGLPDPSEGDRTLTAEERAIYVGTYDIQVLELRIFEEDGQLMAQGSGQGAFPIHAQGDHTFRADFDASLRITFTVEGGRATAMTLEQAGQTFSGPRVEDGDV